MQIVFFTGVCVTLHGWWDKKSLLLGEKVAGNDFDAYIHFMDLWVSPVLVPHGQTKTCSKVFLCLDQFWYYIDWIHWFHYLLGL